MWLPDPSGSVPTAQPAPCGPCEHPIRLVRSDLASGEPAADRVLYVRCGSRRAVICRHCARLYRRDALLIAESGYRPATPYTVLTLTAPGFGPQHHVAFARPRRCTPRRRCPNCHAEVPVCRRVHRADDACAGAPVCDCFDYFSAVRWNQHVSALFAETMRRLNALHRGTGRLDYLAVREVQRRGLVHLHIIIRGALDERAARAVIADAEVAGCRWGANCDVSLVPADDRSNLTRRFRYLAKYIAKRGTDFIVPSDGPVAEHLARMRAVAALLARRPDCDCQSGYPMEPLPGHECRSCRRSTVGLGYAGHTVTKSHGWGLSFKALKATRRTWAASQSSQETEQRWRKAGIGYLPEHDEWSLAAHQHRGDLPPPSDRRLAVLSERLRVAGAPMPAILGLLDGVEPAGGPEPIMVIS